MLISEEFPEIHHSVADADDIEEVWDDEIPVGDVLKNLVVHPGQLVTRWNWKSVCLAVAVRSTFYFTIYKLSRESWLVTMTAVLVEMFFRFLTTGIAGAMVQSFRKAKPYWLANIIVSILLPGFSHTIEFVTHYVQEAYFSNVFPASANAGRQRTFAISVLFSVLSVLFNLYAMRNGVLLVGAGEDTPSLWSDLKKVPRLLSEFVISLPLMILRFVHERKLSYAFLAFFTFGAVVGTILGTFRVKWQWAWTSALGAWAILLFATLLTAIVRKFLGHEFAPAEA